MKSRGRFILFILLILGHYQGIAQSQCSTTLETIVMDTVVVGTGSADPPYQFTFPKFDTDRGMLTEVNIATVVSLDIGFNIENTKSISQNNVRLKFTRSDEISSLALMNPLASNVFSPTVGWHGPYTLFPSDGITGSGSDFRAIPAFDVFDGDTIFNETLFNTADFLGPGEVTFDYTPSIYQTTSVPTGDAIAINVSARDQIKFIVSYTFCDNSSLPSDIISFTAAKKEDDIVNIRWFTANEVSDRKYELQKSVDGKSFIPVINYQGMPRDNNTGSYEHKYQAEPNEMRKMIFRLKQIEKNGVIKYSPVRLVDLGKENNQPEIRIFPNPSKGGAITVVFDRMTRSDWQLDVLSSSGQTLSRTLVNNGLLAKINMDNKLTAGLYFIKATNKKTQEQHIQRLIIQ